MPLQNRVNPFGEIVAIPERGTMMGNRGVLHDESRRIVRQWQLRRWIACRTEFRGRRRAVMQPRRYTELFFLDEAAALSAGHRPCAECRNADFRRFRSLWERCLGGPVSVESIDEKLQRERLSGREKRTYRAPIAGLPDGAYVALDGLAWLVWGGELLVWSGSRYAQRPSRTRCGEAEVLTPQSIVAVLAAGYRPSVHPSATYGR